MAEINLMLLRFLFLVSLLFLILESDQISLTMYSLGSILAILGVLGALVVNFMSLGLSWLLFALIAIVGLCMMLTETDMGKWFMHMAGMLAGALVSSYAIIWLFNFFC